MNNSSNIYKCDKHLTIIHISDIQEGEYGIKGDIPIENYENNEYLNYLEDLRSKLDTLHRENKIDFVVISGDLASKGLKEEYDNLTKEFMPMLNEVFLQGKTMVPKQRWIVVPGNHDVEWGKSDSRFDNFVKFCKDNGIHRYKLDKPDSIYSDIVCEDNITGNTFGLIGLNSCLDILDESSENKRNISKRYFSIFSKDWDDQFKNMPKLMVCHHTLHTIKSENYDHALNALNDNNVLLSLVGDIHKSDSGADEICRIRCLIAGSISAKKKERKIGIDAIPRQFNLIKINLQSGNVDWYTYMYEGTWREIKNISFTLEHPNFLKSAAPETESKARTSGIYDYEKSLKKCLEAVNNVINLYFDHFDKQKNITSIPLQNRESIKSDILALNTHKITAEKVDLFISGSWDGSKHDNSKSHRIHITIADLSIVVNQHDYGQAQNIRINLGGEVATSLVKVKEYLSTSLIYREYTMIKELRKYSDIIQHHHPYDNIIINKIDNYIEQGKWNRAKNELLHKLDNDKNGIENIMANLFPLLKLFERRKELNAQFKLEKKTSNGTLYSISAEELAKQFYNESVNTRKNLIEEIRVTEKTLDDILKMVNVLFSKDGIELFTGILFKKEASRFEGVLKTYRGVFHQFLAERKDGEKIEKNEFMTIINSLYDKINTVLIKDVFETFFPEVLRTLDECREDLS